MEVGAHVWCNSKDDEAWILGEITAKSDEEISVFQVEKPENKFTRPRVKAKADGPVEVKYEGVELANAPLSEAEKAEGLDDDIISLVHLHEPALLHAISERFLDGKIYTWTGPVLIAVNPFERLRLYTTEILESYRQEGLLRSQGMGDSKSALGPHIYSIADRSYRQMMSEQRKSQSILISGESGAGKTESTKIVMLYLTTLGSANIGGGGEGASEEDNMSIMDKVLQSNPVLESFGNAKTLRNDNSSRFGKYIELGFSRSGSLLGAKVQTYLLEKVRLGFHGSGERNYHIFYHLLRGADEEMRKRFRFRDGETQGLELCAYYHYTGQGGAPNLRNFTDDAGFKFMIKGMKTVGWSEELIDNVLALCAGILHLGQINFNAEEGDGGTEMAVPVDEQLVVDAADHLGVDLEKLKICLSERQIVTRGEVLKVALSAAEAVNARDALAKTIFGALFLWVVDQVNQTCGWSDDSEVKSSCGVLDIFGFESFAVNSFEQLCINFTNEALQQQFNKFIFKMEQAEYESEKIDWAFISFPDNQDCLDTIQSRPKGILPMLDDECKLGSRGSDKNWANRLYKELLPKNLQTVSDNGRFSATAVQKAKGIFCVFHFAGNVAYTAETGFLEKNRDEIPLTAKNLFETAPSQLIKDLIAVQIKQTEEQSSSKSKKGGPAKTKTVGQQFKEQLTDLMERVEKTEPHYIRCLKPNDAAKPKMLTKRRLTDQLRCGGVLEAVKVARMGFPVRLKHSAFFERYRMLSPSTPDSVLTWNLDGGEEAQQFCIKLVDILLAEGAKSKGNEGAKLDAKEEGISRTEKIRRMQFTPPPMDFPKTDIQLGLTKVFMRKPPHDALEAHRVFHQNVSAILLQSWIRAAQTRLKYLVKAESALTMQRWYRGCVGRARWWKLKEEVSSVLLTKHFRMEVYRRRYNRARRGTVRFQGVYRGHAVRRVLAAIRVQTKWRMHKRYVMYKKLKSATISLQTIQRGIVARGVLEGLRAEQKDIGRLKESNEQLKLEMASLKAMLAAQAQGAESKKEMDDQILEKEREIDGLQSRLQDMQHELEKERNSIKDLEQSLEAQREETAKQMDALRQQREESAAQMEKLQQHHLSAATETAAEIDRLKQENQLQREKLARSSSQRSIPAQTYQPPANNEQSIADPKEHLKASPRTVSVSPEILAEHQEALARLEDELEAERQMRMELDAEVMKLRSNVNGVPVDEDAVSALVHPAEDSVGSKPVINVIPEEMEEDDVPRPAPVAASVPVPAPVAVAAPEPAPAPVAAPEVPSSPVAAPEVPSSPMAAPEVPSSPVAAPKVPSSPVAMPKVPSSPVAPPKVPSSPVAPPKVPSSPVAPPKVPSSPVAPPKVPSSPVAPPKVPSSPVAPPKVPSSPIPVKAPEIAPPESAPAHEPEPASPVQHVAKVRPVMNGGSSSAPQDIAPEVTGAEEEKEPQMQAAIHNSVKTEVPVESLQTPRKKSFAADGSSVAKEKTKKIDHELQEIKKESVTPGVVSALTKLGVSNAKENRVFNGDTEKPPSKPQRHEEPRSRPLFHRSPSEYFPMIRRGLSSLSEETEPVEQDVAVGWKVDVTNRKEREEALRDEARRLEARLNTFYSSLEEGIDVVMWQLNRNAEFAPGEVNAEEFLLKATPVQLKLVKRGDMLVQAVLVFNARGGYLSRALGRHRVDKSALEPLSLHEVLEVRAGCVGYDHTELPISGKPNKGKSKSENKLGSLFLTLKASPTPMALSRAYFLRFKSRSARNDLLVGLRGLLADLQIHEGVGISAMHMPGSQPESAPVTRASFRRMPGSKRDVHAEDPVDAIPAMVPNSDMMVPLGEVHNALNKQRELYDRLILIMLQGTADLKHKEDEILGLHGRLDEATAESDEKDKIQANDSKLIMQLSKKLETLLMDNEDLRDQNDRLNTRLVAVECEKMNLMGN